MPSNSSSLTPLSATALILTLSPAALAASCRPAPASRPQRVIAANFCSSSVSSETLMRFHPGLPRSSAYFASWLPLVVSVSSSSARADMPRRAREQLMMFLRTSGSPPVRRSFFTPLADKSAAQPVQFLQRQDFRFWQKRHVFRHAVDAAEIAAVGDRNAEIGDGTAERIEHDGELYGSQRYVFE